ncbi:MAG TPA: methylated-DNA--[protein]-cysteine S-methyltransferase, partial [Ktedonobacterales bacterium]|nr:methylated-DNA--[protein]-cysteine S-methyltransferase [Ktedonobacterales bacterium]
RVFDVPLDLEGTPFFRQVWEMVARIPFGQTQSYADVARTVAREKAVRAVGAANGANPVPIFVPCHRVIGSNGKLTGFGPGIALKAALLRHEGLAIPQGGQ